MSLMKPLLLTSAILAAYPALAQTANAQQATQDPAAKPDAKADAKAAAEPAVEIGRVIVTARRIGEQMQDVPLSIVALSGKDLADRGVTSIADLSLLTPGLSYSTDLGRDAERPVVRGIGVSRPDSPQPVSIFIDGVYVRDGALSLGIDDAQRIEVIKGPQSALYGRSTYAGAINYVTVKPGTTLAGKVSTTFASDGERSYFGALTVPLMSDVLSMRVRLKKYEFGGQYTNSQDGEKLGTERTNSSGATFFLHPSDRFDATLSLDSARDRDGAYAASARTIPTQAHGVVTNQNGSTNVANGSSCNGHTINLVGTDPATGLPSASIPASASTLANGWPCGASNFSGTTVTSDVRDMANYTDPATGKNYGDIAGLDRKIDRSALTLNFYFGDYTLTSQTAFTKEQTNLGVDQSYSGTAFAPGYGYPATSWLTYDRDKLNYSSQELRLTSPTDEALSWMFGGFFYKEDGSGMTSSVIAQDAQLQTIADPLRPKASKSVKSVAPFGRIQYQIGDATRVSLEARYSEDTVRVDGTPLGTAVVSAGTCVAGEVCAVSGERTFKDFAPRLSVDYKVNKEMMVYAQAAKGSKNGGFNTSAGIPAQNFNYDGEKITAFEIGSKNRFLNGQMLLNLALFQNDISGLQLSNIINYISPLTGINVTDTVVNNVGKARTRGFEGELDYQLTPWLLLSGNYAYTDAKAIEGTESTNGTVFGGNMSVAGFALPRAPKHSAAISAALDLPITGTSLHFTSHVDVSYESRRYADIQNLIWADAFTRVNFNLGVRSKAWRIVGFVRNATNDTTPTNSLRYFDATTFRRNAVDFLPRQRQFGVTLAYDF